VSQPAKELLYIPAILLLGGIYWLQRRRQRLGFSSTSTA